MRVLIDEWVDLSLDEWVDLALDECVDPGIIGLLNGHQVTAVKGDWQGTRTKTLFASHKAISTFC